MASTELGTTYLSRIPRSVLLQWRLGTEGLWVPLTGRCLSLWAAGAACLRKESTRLPRKAGSPAPCRHLRNHSIGRERYEPQAKYAHIIPSLHHQVGCLAVLPTSWRMSRAHHWPRCTGAFCDDRQAQSITLRGSCRRSRRSIDPPLRFG